MPGQERIDCRSSLLAMQKSVQLMQVTSARRQDVVRRYKETHSNFDAFADKVAFQMNDTHPTIAVAELMRVLMDENNLGWTRSWELTTKVRAARRRWPSWIRDRMVVCMHVTYTNIQEHPASRPQMHSFPVAVLPNSAQSVSEDNASTALTHV